MDQESVVFGRMEDVVYTKASKASLIVSRLSFLQYISILGALGVSFLPSLFVILAENFHFSY